MAKESQGNPNAVSGAGAVGLMQMKPDTASEMAGRNVTAEELKSNPQLATDLGAKYLRKQIDEGGSVEAGLGRYNQGPNSDWKASPEAQDYIKSITKSTQTGEMPTWG